MQTRARQWQVEEKGIGFVPTMGCLHAGHMSLVKRARRIVGQHGKVVVSIYVNPLQFGPKEDFRRYPRDLDTDQKLCAAEGADILFAPADHEMYPDSNRSSTYVLEEKLSRQMEGASRPGHFRGVTTVVAKLFNIVLPNVAVFGEKDFQQAAVVRRMTQDLNFPVQIEVAPTQREEDGLAMSSRNRYLSPEERAQAVILWRAIQEAKKAVSASTTPILAETLRVRVGTLIETQPSARIDYIEFFHPATLEPSRDVSAGTQMALAVFIGKTRLIDNAAL